MLCKYKDLDDEASAIEESVGDEKSSRKRELIALIYELVDKKRGKSRSLNDYICDFIVNYIKSGEGSSLNAVQLTYILKVVRSNGANEIHITGVSALILFNAVGEFDYVETI